MDAERLNRWLALLANIGVIVGIAFLAVEIQQSNRIAIAITEIEIRNSFGSINESFYTNPSVSNLMAKLDDSDVELTAAEDFELYNVILRLINGWLAVETACSNEMVPESTCELIANNINGWFVRRPITLPFWQRAVDGYPAFSDTTTMKEIKRQIELLEAELSN